MRQINRGKMPQDYKRKRDRYFKISKSGKISEIIDPETTLKLLTNHSNSGNLLLFFSYGIFAFLIYRYILISKLVAIMVLGMSLFFGFRYFYKKIKRGKND